MKKWLLIIVAVVFLAGFGFVYSGENCGGQSGKSCTGQCSGKSCSSLCSGKSCTGTCGSMGAGQCSGKSCAGKCGGTCKGKCDRPEWAYTYESADFYPDAAPRELKNFHSVLLPIREARKSGETAYVRENAGHLYYAAKEVKDSRPCVDKMQQKHYATAAKELVRDSKRLKEMVHGGSNDAVMELVTQIEEDFVRLANLAECH